MGETEEEEEKDDEDEAALEAPRATLRRGTPRPPSFEAAPRSHPLDDGMSYETLWSPVARIPTPPLSAMLRPSPFPVISLSPLPGSSCASWITRMMRPPTSTEPEEKINEFLVYKRAAKSFRADLCNRKDSLGLASGKMFLTLMDMTKVTSG